MAQQHPQAKPREPQDEPRQPPTMDQESPTIAQPSPKMTQESPKIGAKTHVHACPGQVSNHVGPIARHLCFISSHLEAMLRRSGCYPMARQARDRPKTDQDSSKTGPPNRACHMLSSSQRRACLELPWSCPELLVSKQILPRSSKIVDG
jgi:hypothetical protein